MASKLLALIVIASSISPLAHSAEVQLFWDAPTTLVTGDPLTDLASYEIWHGCEQSGVYDSVDVVQAPVETYTVTGLPPSSTCYFAAKSTRATGVSSEFSNEATYTTMALPLPGQISNLQITWRSAALPAGWINALIDGGNRIIVDSSVIYENGRYTIFHEGGEIWKTSDHFRAPVFEIGPTADISFSADIVQSHTGTLASFPKSGPMLRESHNPSSPNVFANILGVDGAKGSNVSIRSALGVNTTKTNFPDPPVTLCWSLRIDVDRSLGSWRAYRSTSCLNRLWVQFASGSEPWMIEGSPIQALLACTVNDSQDIGYSGECVIENVTLDLVTPVNH